jgi:phage gpG-like protein
VKVDVRGIKEIKAALKKMQARTVDLSPVLKVAVNDLNTMETDAFRKSVDPGTGSPWAPLSETTLARRRKGTGRGGPKTLWDTGHLRGSLVSKSENSVASAGRDLVVFGTNVPYAAVHQDGSKQKNIPKRQFLPTQWNVVGTPAYNAMKKIASRVRNYILTGKTAVEPGFKL